MRRMIKHMAEKKMQKIARFLGIEGIDKDCVYSVMGLTAFVLIGWAAMWIVY